MHAVGGHHGVGFDLVAVREREADAAVGLLFEADQLVIEMHGLRGNGAGERGVQVAAMAQQIGRAVFRLGAFAEDHVEADLAGVVFPVVPGARIERMRAHRCFQPEPAQHLHGVAADLDAGAEPGEFRGLFVDVGLDAGAVQGGGGREAAHSGPDNGHGKFCHKDFLVRLLDIVRRDAMAQHRHHYRPLAALIRKRVILTGREFLSAL